MSEPIPRAAIAPTVLPLQLQMLLILQPCKLRMLLGFFFSCDASFDLQNPTSSNQTGFGVVILTQPATSILHASFFFLHVAIARALEPLEAKAHALPFNAELALDLHNTTLCTDNLGAGLHRTY